MPEIPLTPAQEAAIAESLGLAPGDGPPTAAMLLAVFDASAVIETEGRRRMLGLKPEDGEPTPAMAAVVVAAEETVDGEWQRWHGLE